MSGMYLLASILCLAVGGSMAQVMEGNYNVTSVCTTVKVGTQLGSIESCEYYYVCTQNGPVKTYCQQGYSYNYKQQSCSPSANVECYYGLANPCQDKTTEVWVPVTGTCNQFIFCNKTVNGGQGSCGSLYFNYTAQACTYGECDETSTDGPNLLSLCEVVPPNIWFGSTDNCKTYNYCYPTGRLASANCTTSAFVVSSGSCGYDVGNNCDRVVADAVPNNCYTAGNTTYDSTVCSSYYLCNGKTFEPKSCPTGQYYDTNLKGCALRQAAVAAPGCNRCQYATTPFVNAAASEYCMNYYYCNKGQHAAESSCPSGYFFNEDDQGCVSNSELPSYTNNHGACHGATAEPTPTAAPTTAGSTSDTTTTPEPTTTTTEAEAGGESGGE